MPFRVKRVYDRPTRDDGFRVLVDRLWPRGLSKRKAMLDLWAKEVAPSPDLRKWFGHDQKGSHPLNVMIPPQRKMAVPAGELQKLPSFNQRGSE